VKGEIFVVLFGFWNFVFGVRAKEVKGGQRSKVKGEKVKGER